MASFSILHGNVSFCSFVFLSFLLRSWSDGASGPSGAAAVVGGLAAATQGSNYGTQVGGAFGVGAGAYLIRSGFDKRAEARMHMEALEELGQSLESEVAPQVISLEDRTITLTGSVEEQYEQWREILADLYAVEVGQL